MQNLPPTEYPGGELELFAAATTWKKYWSGKIARYLHGDVLEVGAGNGNNTQVLRTAAQRRWVCLEPDKRLLTQLQSRIAGNCEGITGTIEQLATDRLFDAILYLDVLEHIRDDDAELETAATLLRPGGHLIILAPAHPFLFSPFDEAIGHYRRYTKSSLLAIAPTGLKLEQLRYLDSCGLTLSLANRVLLRQRLPTARQLRFWDRIIVPISRLVDPATGGTVGKSVLAIWSKPAPSGQG